MKIATFFAAAVLFAGTALAQQPIPIQNLPQASIPLSQNDLTIIGQSNVARKATIAQLLAGSSFGSQAANKFFAGPTSGPAAAPAFRSIGAGDLPDTYASLDLPNTFTGNNYFGTGRPWVDVRAKGAKGDSATDDTAAFNSAVSALAAVGGGIVYVPPSTGTYCLNSGITISSPYIRLVGAQTLSSLISACGHDVTLLTINANHVGVQNLGINGKGTNNDTGTFGASHPTLLVGSSCIDCTVDDNYIVGGLYGIQNQSGEAEFFRNFVSDSYGTALVYSTGGGWWNRMKADQVWICGEPAYGTNVFATWQANHTYSAGAVVTKSGYFLQTCGGGVSGSSSPTLKNYNIIMQDGTVQWYLLAPTDFASLLLDTGASENYAFQWDGTGAFANGMEMDNRLSGVVPAHFKCEECTFSQNINAGYLIKYGGDVHLTDNNVGGCVISGCIGILFQSPWGSVATIKGGNIVATDAGIEIFSGGYVTITGVVITSAIDYGIQFSGTPGVTIQGNIIPSAGTAAINSTGAADYYNIIGNICIGSVACVLDQASGTHKTVTGNN
jgi:pectate lyase-like protein/copper-binding protein NosD